MDTKEKEQRSVYRRARPIAYLAGGAVMSSVIADKMPGTSGVPLQKVGTGLAGFVGPAVAATGAMMVMSSLKKIPKPKKRKGGKK